MKTYRILLLMLCLFSMAITSCSNNDENDDLIIYDFMPIEVRFDIQNEKGESLLVADREGSIFNTDAVKLIYDGKEYTPFWTYEDKHNSVSRYLPTYLYGLYIDTYYETYDKSRPVLSVGEFDRGMDLDETFTIVCNEKSYNFRIINKVTWKKHKPEISTTTYLNGKEIDGLAVIKY